MKPPISCIVYRPVALVLLVVCSVTSLLPDVRWLQDACCLALLPLLAVVGAMVLFEHVSSSRLLFVDAVREADKTDLTSQRR